MAKNKTQELDDWNFLRKVTSRAMTHYVNLDTTMLAQDIALLEDRLEDICESIASDFFNGEDINPDLEDTYSRKCNFQRIYKNSIKNLRLRLNQITVSADSLPIDIFLLQLDYESRQIPECAVREREIPVDDNPTRVREFEKTYRGLMLRYRPGNSVGPD